MMYCNWFQKSVPKNLKSVYPPPLLKKKTIYNLQYPDTDKDW